MSAVDVSNQFEVLAPSEVEEKQEGGLRSRFSKDDIKEQAFQAKEAIKAKAIDLKDMVVNKTQALANTEILSNVSTQLQSGLQSGIDLVKEKAGISHTTSNEEAAQIVKDQAEGEWHEVKRKGSHKMKHARDIVNEKLDENLTPKQRQQLNMAKHQAKKGMHMAERRAERFSSKVVNLVFQGQRLRPVKNFIHKRHLELPVVVMLSLLTLWFGLTLIRLFTLATVPKVPEFDIHSSEATLDWLKYHAGDFKDRVSDTKDSLTTRAATFLANHQWENLKDSAIDWKDIGLRKLGLAEPTWGEWIWAKITGRPITWQERVTSVLDLTKQGLSRSDLKSPGIIASIRHLLHPHEPTVSERAAQYVKDHMPGQQEGVVDGLKHKLSDGIDSIRSHLPGGSDLSEAAKQKAYEATHQSMTDRIVNGATYIKNRVVHGAQEAAHIAQDRANEAMDKAKYKTGL